MENEADKNEDVDSDRERPLAQADEVEEELVRRQERLDSLKVLKAALESELEKVSMRGAVRSGDVRLMLLTENHQKTLRGRLRKQDKSIREAEEELERARERYEELHFTEKAY